MSTREEIEKGVTKLFKPYIVKRDRGQCQILLPLIELDNFVDTLFLYEDSLGVVIRAKCPDCEWMQFSNEYVGMTPCPRCNSTGYIYEPLIKGD